MSKNANASNPPSVHPVSAGKKRMATKTLAACALLCALSVVFARFTTVMPSAISRFSIEAVPIALAGYLFGPLAGVMVGGVADTVGCLFSGYGWDPVLTVSPMLLGLFAGLLRALLPGMKKPWDVWRVAVTLLPGKILGSVLWQSYWLIFLGYSKKGLGALLAYRSVEAGLELVLDSLILFFLLRSGLFQRLQLWPPKKSVNPSGRLAFTPRRITLNGVFTAIFFVLSMFSVTIGGIKVTFDSFPVVLAAMLFGPADAFLVGFLGALLEQMLHFGFTATTLLWIIPPAVRGLVIGLSVLLLRPHMGLDAIVRRKKPFVYLASCILAGLVTSGLNTLVYYVDSVINHYYEYHLIFGVAGIRLLSGTAVAAVTALAAVPVLAALAKARIAVPRADLTAES